MDEACDSIVSRLQSKVAGVRVEHFPDKFDPRTFGSSEPRLLVHYAGSAYGSDESMSPLSTTRTPEFAVAIIVRNLRSTGGLGATGLIDAVRKALYGFRPTKKNELNEDVPIGLGPLRPTRDEYVEHADGVWRFDVIFSARTTVVEDKQPLTGPKLTSVTWEGTPA